MHELVAICVRLSYRDWMHVRGPSGYRAESGTPPFTSFHDRSIDVARARVRRRAMATRSSGSLNSPGRKSIMPRFTKRSAVLVLALICVLAVGPATAGEP